MLHEGYRPLDSDGRQMDFTTNTVEGSSTSLNQVETGDSSIGVRCANDSTGGQISIHALHLASYATRQRHIPHRRIIRDLIDLSALGWRHGIGAIHITELAFLRGRYRHVCVLNVLAVKRRGRHENELFTLGGLLGPTLPGPNLRANDGTSLLDHDHYIR